MPSSLISFATIAAMFLAVESTGRSQGLAPRAMPMAPAYPAVPASPASYLPPERMQVVDPDKKLSAGDFVTVEIVEDKKGGVQRAVTAAGAIDVPPGIRIQVSGKTTTEAAAEIKRRLEAEYYHRATVKLSIDRVSPVQVRSGTVILSGEVRMVGPQEMIAGEPLRLSSAILKAGGFTQWAEQKKVQVTSQVNGAAKSKDYNVKKIIEKGDENEDPILQDGDRIHVPKTWIRF